MATTTKTATPDASARPEKWSFYVWVAVVLAVGSVAVILGWHSGGGTVDPSVAANARHMSRTTAVINSAILVFREGLETILVLAAITASFRGANSVYKRPVAVGGGSDCSPRWDLVCRDRDHQPARWQRPEPPGGHRHPGDHRAADRDELVLPQGLLDRLDLAPPQAPQGPAERRCDANLRATLLGFGLLGFTSIYREGFEVVIFLQSLRVTFGSSVVLEGVTLGFMFTAAVGVLTFSLHQKLPYKRLLIITGAMLLVVLFVMVGEEVNEMQLAGWIGTTSIGNWPGLAWAVVLAVPERRDDRRSVRRDRARARLLPARRVSARLAAASPRARRPPRSPPSRRPRSWPRSATQQRRSPSPRWLPTPR